VPLKLRAHSFLSSLYGYYAIETVHDPNLQQLWRLFTLMIVQSHHGALAKPAAIARKFADPDAQRVLSTQIKEIDMINELDTDLINLQMPKFSDFADQINDTIKSVLRCGGSFSNIKTKFKDPFAPYFILNTLYSSLIDADRMDAAGLSFLQRPSLDSSGVYEYVTKLQEEKTKSNDAETEVLATRRKLFNQISEMANCVPFDEHIFSLTAPTGLGKTLTGFYFAMKLKERLSRTVENPRIIYVAPFLSILDQNFEVLREALGLKCPQSDMLLLHHHLAEMQYHSNQETNDTYDSLKSELLIEGWNSEVIVSTFIQFFYAIMGSTPNQLRRFHNIANSIVILDEVQSIPHEYWPLVRDMIRRLTEKLGVYVILMTATQPLIFDTHEIKELVAIPKEQLWKPRVTFRFNTDQSMRMKDFQCKVGQLTDSCQDKSILILMNTISSAAKVFQHLKRNREKYYLSANVLPIERKQRIEEISYRLKQGYPIILVSTQVIEAGVDLDFNMVIRDMGPIDSIIQTAGRCNRNGKRNPEQSEVFVYTVKNENDREFGRIVYGNFLIEKSLNAIRESDKTIYDLTHRYYSEVRKASSELKSNKLIDAVTNLDYEMIRDEFKLIDEKSSHSLFVELDGNASKVWKQYLGIIKSESSGLEKKKAFLKLRCDLYKYVINVNLPQEMNLSQENGFYFLPNSLKTLYYDSQTGFADKDIICEEE